jgi:hypothetical protein
MSAFILSDDGKLTHAPQFAGSEGISLGKKIPVGARRKPREERQRKRRENINAVVSTHTHNNDTMQFLVALASCSLPCPRAAHLFQVSQDIISEDETLTASWKKSWNTD